MEKKILFLDYDGVLFDTLREIYLVNRCAYKKIDFLDEIDTSEYERYSKYKYLAYNIWMFYYYNPVIFDETKDELILEKFNELLKTRNEAIENQFCRQFLNIRADLVRNHFEFWKNLEKPYGFFEFIKSLSENESIDIVIVSKKNKNSIIDRFKTNNFNLNEDKIFGREILDKYSSKGEFIEEYMNNNDYTSAIFVDDNINNLKTVKNTNVKTILALWGNSGPNLTGCSEQEAMEIINDYFM